MSGLSDFDFPFINNPDSANMLNQLKQFRAKTKSFYEESDAILRDYETRIGSLDDSMSSHTHTKASVGLGNVDNYATATQAEAEAGSVNDKLMTPLGTKQAVDKRIGTAGPASYRNKLGNCSFLVNQMGLSFTIAPGVSLLSTTDLWGVQNSTNQPVTVTIETMNIYSRQVNRMRLAFATAPTSGGINVYQRIENCNTLAGSTVCLSVNMFSLENMSITPDLRQVFGSGGAADGLTYLSSFTVSGADFYRYAAKGSLPATTGKTQGAGHFLQLTMPIPIRSTNPFYLVLPQLEEGNNPSPIEYVEDWVDWARCRRRYYRSSGVTIVGSPGSASSTSRYLTFPFPVQMRAVPTITTTGNYTWSSQWTFGSFVQLVCSPGNTSSQATLDYIEADARF